VIRTTLLLIGLLVAALCGWAEMTTSTTPLPDSRYPAHWWKPVPREQAASWEILPQEAGPGEVILSKRNELGLMSNFAATTFTLDGATYPSLEGFWQMMLYPEGPNDPRATTSGVTWKYTREQVSQMVGFEANAAGQLALDNMKKMGINWVTYKGRKMDYYVPTKNDHYDLIVRATRAKLAQNPEVRRVLLATGDLVLRPDHHQPADAPPSWHYFDIYMQLRKELQQQAQPSTAPARP
jgi:predicted NAD-dependent protein-ADP-ribosyltransferase YbiA (DUF1768 family)